MRDAAARLAARLSFGERARERCWKKLGRQMTSTRLPLSYCFAMLEHRAREDHSPLATVYADVRASLGRGLSIGQAISPWAGPEEVMLIDAGQTTGEAGLARGFTRAAEFMEKKRRARSQLTGELAYPLALLLCVAAFLVMISITLMPRLAELSNPHSWTGAGAALYATATFTASWKGAALAFALLALACLCSWSMPRWTGRSRAMADCLPPWSIYRLLTGTGWLYATATLLQGREMKLGQILRRLLAAPETSPYLRWRLTPVLEGDSLGLTLGEALCKAPDRWPDPAMADDLRAYSSLPDFNNLLAGIAEELAEDGMERVRVLSARLHSAALMIVVASLCLLVTGIFGIQEQITASVGAVGNL